MRLDFGIQRNERNCRLVKKLDTFSFLTLHIGRKNPPMTSEAAKIMEKLKDKKAEYEAVASSDSSVNVDDIDNRIITEVLGPERALINLKRRQQRGK
ncbi:hypothetical protein Gotur_030017 [Gossypium turneri]